MKSQISLYFLHYLGRYNDRVIFMKLQGKADVVVCETLQCSVAEWDSKSPPLDRDGSDLYRDMLEHWHDIKSN